MAQTTNDEKTVERRNRELAPAGETPVEKTRAKSSRETSEGPEEGSLPEEGVSGCVSCRIHEIRWQSGLGRSGETGVKLCETWVVTETSEVRRSMRRTGKRKPGTTNEKLAEADGAA